jgi:alkanesulfonate monooxygenase SsuD/methylene tetrahydromethanopterin reductase-like flavin-dependent oxidoreductase (luciferase family)
MADGWIGAGSSTPREFRKQASQVLGHLKEADRDASSFSIAKRVYIAVTTDRDRAHARLRDWFGRFYQDPQLADRVVLLGDLRQCRDGLAELEDAGAKLLILNPVFDELDQIRLLQDVL